MHFPAQLVASVVDEDSGTHENGAMYLAKHSEDALVYLTHAKD